MPGWSCYPCWQICVDAACRRGSRRPVAARPTAGRGSAALGTAAGAPFLPKLAQIAEGNLAFAVGLMVLLMVVTVGYLPLVLPVLLPGVSVNPAKIARSLFLLMLLPLAGALAVSPVRGCRRAHETRARSGLQPEPHSAGVADHCGEHQQRAGRVRHARHPRRSPLHCRGFWHRVVARRTRHGHAAGPALGTAQRNIAAALVVGSQSFRDPKVVVMVVVVAIVSLLVLMPLSRLLAKRG